MLRRRPETCIMLEFHLQTKTIGADSTKSQVQNKNKKTKPPQSTKYWNPDELLRASTFRPGPLRPCISLVTSQSEAAAYFGMSLPTPLSWSSSSSVVRPVSRIMRSLLPCIPEACQCSHIYVWLWLHAAALDQ